MSQKKSRISCCVVGCSQSYSNTFDVRLFRFPGRSWEMERRSAWIKAVNRTNVDGSDWQPTRNTYICNLHFQGGEPVNNPNNPAYLPTIFPTAYKRKSPNSTENFARYDRAKKRGKQTGVEKLETITTGNPTAVRRLNKGAVPSIFTYKCKEEKVPVIMQKRGHYCCICNRNNGDHHHLTFHSFPMRGRSFINVEDDVSGVVVKRDRLTLWTEFAKITEVLTTARDICSLHFKHDDYIYPGHNRKHRTLKITAVPSIYNVDDTGSPAEDFAASQLPPHHQDQEDEMQIDTLDDVIRPPDMLCAIYSLPDANPAELDTQDPVLSSQSRANNTQVLDITDDMDSFYSRCLLCTCRPDATPHLEIFSEAGNQLKLAEKINKYLNIQIGTELPQRVCQRCLEKLDVTHELVTVSQQARILLLQIKQQSRSLDTEVTFLDQDNLDNSCTEKTFEHVDIPQTHVQIKAEQDSTDSNCSVIGSELDPLEPTIDYAEENTIDVPLTGERDDLDSNSSGVDFDQSSNDPIVQSNEEPKCDTVCETTSKSDILPEKPEVCRPTEEAEKDGVSEEDFVKCLQCTFVIYKNYMAFHVKTHHGEMTPVVPKIIDETIMKQMQQTRRSLILDWRMCTICKTRFYSQVLDLHMLLRHTEPSADNSEKAEDLPTTDLSRLKQCPACPCMFFPESMQGHIAEEHPPTPNPDLEKPMMCTYCHLKVTYREMSEHLKLKHGPYAWTHCIHCKKKIMNTDMDMETHLFQEHSGGNLLACRICDRRYSSTGKEQAHMQTFLSCKYKCPSKSCSKRFVILPSFKDHVLSCHPKIEHIMQIEIKKETEDILANKIPAVVDSIISMDSVEELADEELESKEVDENSENNKSDENSKHNKTDENSEINETLETPVNKKSAQDPNAIEIQEIPLPLKFKPFATKVKYDYGGPVECDICKETVKHKWFLMQHKNKVHNLTVRYNCEDCGTNYKYMHGILNHIQLSHVPKDHVCETCGEVFTRRRYAQHLLWHKRFPNGVEPRNLLDRPLDPVRCGMCNRPARNKYALLTHINAVHLDVVGEHLPFHCEPCDKEFANYEYLMHHHYSMHLPKIVCTYCGKLINQNRMSMHLRIHEPDRGPNYKGNKRGRKRKRALN